MSDSLSACNYARVPLVTTHFRQPFNIVRILLLCRVGYLSFFAKRLKRFARRSFAKNASGHVDATCRALPTFCQGAKKSFGPNIPESLDRTCPMATTFTWLRPDRLLVMEPLQRNCEKEKEWPPRNNCLRKSVLIFGFCYLD